MQRIHPRSGSFRRHFQIDHGDPAIDAVIQGGRRKPQRQSRLPACRVATNTNKAFDPNTPARTATNRIKSRQISRNGRDRFVNLFMEMIQELRCEYVLLHPICGVAHAGSSSVWIVFP